MKRISSFLLIGCSLILLHCTKKPEPKPPPLAKIDLSKRDSYGMQLRPFLKPNLTFHTNSIMRMETDANEQLLVTVSLDKTVKIWSLPDLDLMNTIYPPTGSNNEGKLYSLAISPDGNNLAVGGWLTTNNTDIYVYVYDINSGFLKNKLKGLDDIPVHMCYSKTGKYLAAVLNNKNGLRVWDTENNFQLIAVDFDYDDSSFYCRFNSDDRLITSSYDGYIRIYTPEFKLLIKKSGPNGNKPLSTPFSPDGKLVAVGYTDSSKVDILSANLLDYRYSMDTQNINTGGLGQVAWSHDSLFLFGGGRYHNQDGIFPVRIWPQIGNANYREIGKNVNTIMGITVLKNYEVIISSQEPSLQFFNSNGAPAKKLVPEIPNFNFSVNQLGVSEDGSEITFYSRYEGKVYESYFNAKTDTLSGEIPKNGIHYPKNSAGSLSVKKGSASSILINNRMDIPLEGNESVRCFALNDTGTEIYTGTEFSIQILNARGFNRLTIPVQSSVDQINVSKDGRWIIAAHQNGSVRWYAADTGELVLIFLLRMSDYEWVLYKPNNEYTTSENGENLVSWRQNVADQFISEVFPAEKYHEYYYKPDLTQQMFF